MIRAFALLLALLAGCAGTARPSPHHGQRAQTSTTASMGMYPSALGLPSRLVDTRTRRVVSKREALQAMAASKVVYVGESHDDPHHHAIQAALLLDLWAIDRQLAVGMEMFQRPYQDALDAYLAGDIDEAELLSRTEWSERWGFDFALYRPILELARAHRVAVVALNAPRELTRQISRGGLGSLSPEQKAQLPEMDLGNATHREQLRAAFEAHQMPADKFEQFYAAQVLWDETMAEQVARTLGSPSSPPRMLVLAGLGHVRGGLGIPSRAARRGARPFTVILPALLAGGRPSLGELLEAPESDYLWVMAGDESALPAVGSAIPR